MKDHDAYEDRAPQKQGTGAGPSGESASKIPSPREGGSSERNDGSNHPAKTPAVSLAQNDDQRISLDIGQRGRNTSSNIPSDASDTNLGTRGDTSTRPTTRSTSMAETIAETSVKKVYEPSKGFFVAPLEPMNAEDIHTWGLLNPRLQDVLLHTFRPKGGTDSSITMQFLMAGAKNALRPTILLTCCTADHRRKLKKILKTQSWLK